MDLVSVAWVPETRLAQSEAQRSRPIVILPAAELRSAPAAGPGGVLLSPDQLQVSLNIAVAG